MVVLVLSSVNEISAADWSCLGSGRMLFETQGWLSANESTLPGESVVTAEFDASGALCSVISWRATHASDPSPYYNVTALLARFSDGPPPTDNGWTLNCAGIGMHSPMLAGPGIAFDAQRVLAHIKAAASTRDQQPSVYGVNFLPRDPARGLPGSLAEVGFTKITGYQRAFLEILGDSYQDYLASLSSRQRWNARRDRKRFAETGQRVSFTTGLAAVGEDLVRLQGGNRAKYGLLRDDEELRLRHSALLRYAGADGLVIRSHRGSACTGFAMFFRMGSALHALCAGFDDTEEKIGPYFECLFHAAIEWACENGIREIDYGIGSAMAKIERGCQMVDVSTWYLPAYRLVDEGRCKDETQG